MNREIKKTQQDKLEVSVDELKHLAIYIEGIYKGQGNLLPLGRVHIDNLWRVIDEYNKK